MHHATSKSFHGIPLPTSHSKRIIPSRSIAGSKAIVITQIILRVAIYSVILFVASASVTAEDRFHETLQNNGKSFLAQNSPVPQPPLTTPAQLEESRSLSRQSQQITLPGQTTKAQTAQTGSIWRTIGALLVVLALFLLGAKLWRKHIPVSNIGLPTEAIEILGRKPIEPHLSVYLIRCGARILVVGSSADGMRTLAEVTDPVEVDFLAGICRRTDQENAFAQSLRTWFNRRSSPHAAPEQVLQSFEVDADENEKTIGQLNIDPSPGYDHISETVHA